jgi:hypothetical protein
MDLTIDVESYLITKMNLVDKSSFSGFLCRIHIIWQNLLAEPGPVEVWCKHGILG